MLGGCTDFYYSASQSPIPLLLFLIHGIETETTAPLHVREGSSALCALDKRDILTALRSQSTWALL